MVQKVKISKTLLSLIGCTCLMLSPAAMAKTSASVYSPKKGVICDKYICADKKGVSKKLTAKYLGTNKANKAFSQGDFDTLAFTFSNGVFCDTKTKLCHVDRYFENGHRSKVDRKMTDKLFK